MSAVGDARKRLMLGEHVPECNPGCDESGHLLISKRAAGELVADVDTLTGLIARTPHTTPRGLAEALVAAGFGRIDAARREIAEAERRGVKRVAQEILLACCHFDRYKGKPEACGYCETAAEIARADSEVQR